MIGKLLAWLALTGVVPASAQPATLRGMEALAGNPVSTSSGAVSGTRLASGTKAYLGIPFAAPPTGPLRWAPPQPARWSGTWNADRKGAACIQVLRPHDINHYFGEEPTSEDCLTLNIWTPAKTREKLPVIVFIYGGGYTIGSSGLPNYGGGALAQRGAVFVNFNYRVGAMGFMAHPELSREQGGHSGNYGLMDQIAALVWVRDNIARFGGDPAKVLVIGQSAGAGSVVALIASAKAKGLFRAAAMSSACNYRTAWPTLAQAEATGTAAQARLGVASLAAMRDLPADRILAIQTESQVGAHVEGIRFGGPIVDGAVLTRQMSAAVAGGSANRVAIIATANTDDIDIPMSPFGAVKTLAEYRATAARLFGAAAPEFLRLFPATTDAEARTSARAAARASGFTLSSRQCAQDQEKLGAAAYVAEFDRKHPYTPGVRIADQDVTTIGAYHTADMPYWFGTLDTYNALRRTRDWTPADRALSGTMMDALIGFARDGRPGNAWPAWRAGDEREMVFGDTAVVRSLDTARLDWMAAHPIARQALPVRPGRPRD